MIIDQHDAARSQIVADRACGIGEYQHLDAKIGQRSDDRPHDRRIALFIIVSATGQHQNRLAG